MDKYKEKCLKLQRRNEVLQAKSDSCDTYRDLAKKYNDDRYSLSNKYEKKIKELSTRNEELYASNIADTEKKDKQIMALSDEIAILKRDLSKYKAKSNK